MGVLRPAGVPPLERGPGAFDQGSPVIGALLALFTCAIFVSTAATNVLAGVLSLAALYAWARYRPFGLLRHPVCVAVFAFYAWLLLREAISTRPPADVLKALDQFRTLAFVVLWAPLFAAPRHRRAVVAAAAAGLLLFIVIALAGWLTLGHLFYPTQIGSYKLHLPPGLHQFVYHFFLRAPDLAGPVFVAATFAAFELAWQDRRRRGWYLAVAVAATAVLFLATARRTSQVAFVLCGLMYLLLHLKLLSLRRRLLLAGASVATVLALLATPAVQDSAGRVFRDVREFTSMPVERRGEVQTSGALRLRFWDVALEVVRESPWIGTGESAYRERFVAHDNALGGTRLQKEHGHPHNEYLHLLGSLGVVGLTLYLAVHAAAVRSGKAQPSREQRHILGYYLIAALSSAVVNSLTIDMVPGHFHALALLVLAFFPWDEPRGAG
ncbi:O-antigen ligase family protein [Ramlibacter pallidus]|uniref:O-antigen ligase family protein n=1 Tax=Ramlibacter pallidus TaxID=2780087 RepID=A0ABR9S579_9BURK|nr:O-antigen ligase family protein [Ramlibacter pallidus]